MMKQDPEAAQRADEQRARLAAFLKRAADEGLIRQDLPDGWALALLGSLIDNMAHLFTHIEPGPAADLVVASRWVEDFSPGALKAIGALELLAAAGLILPAALDIAPVLVPLAATGVVLLFVGAVIMRLRRGEKATIVMDLVYLAMAAFVTWGRFGPASFTG